MPGQTRAEPTQSVGAAVSAPMPAAEVGAGNSATAQDLGLSEADGGLCEPEPAALELPQLTVPYVVLQEGAAAAEAVLHDWAMVVETLLSGWNIAFDAAGVVLADEGGGTQCLPVVALIWNASWGALPSMHMMPANLSPLDARVAMTTILCSDGWAELDAGTQG